MFEMELLSLIILCSIFNEIAYNEQAPSYYVGKKGHLLASQKERRARCS